MIESVPPHRSLDAARQSSTPPPVWQSLLAMLLLAMVVYLPAALRAQFLGFDDNLFFGPDNPEFRAGLAAVLDPHHPIANAYLPVAHLSMWLDWWLGGGQPLLPHLMALLLHALAGTVLVRLLLQLRATVLVAHVAGALFLVHPALAESVAWVSGRKDLLCGLFVFAGLLQTAKFAAGGAGLGRLVVIALLGALAMYSKATAVVQPLLALGICWLAPGSRRRFLAPLVLLLVTAPIAFHHQLLAAAEGTLAAGSVADRIAQVPGAYLHYLRVTVWPRPLNVLYPEVQTLELFRAQLWPALGVVGGLLVAVVVGWLLPRARLAAFGLAAFLVALLPFNTAYPASSIAAADRYLYLALPGAALAVVAAAQWLLPRAGIVLTALLGLPLLWLGGARAHDFGDTAQLWQSSLAVDPENAVAHYNLALELLRRGPAEVETVRGHLEAAAGAARFPIHELRARQVLVQLALQLGDYPLAAANARAAIAAAEAQLARETTAPRQQAALQLVLRARLAAFEPLRQGRDAAGAEANYRAVKQAFPGHPEVVAFEVLRALEPVAAELSAAVAAGRTAVLADDDPRGLEADRRLAAALEEHPGQAQLLVAQASWDRVRGRIWPAIRSYRKAQAADPQCIEAWLGAARMLRERESYSDAERCAAEGLRQRQDPALLQEQALALVGLGRMDDAITILEAYLKGHPHDADAAKVLSNVLSGRAYGRLSEPGSSHAEVLKIVERALAYNPREPRAQLVLGRLARDERRFVDAVQHLEQAHRLMPDYEDAQQLLADSLGQLGFDRLLAKDDEAAADAWLRCLEVAPKAMDVQGIKMQLQRIWRQHEQRGIERKHAGDLAGAAVDFRRCLQIDSQQHWAAWLLATTLFLAAETDLVELERLCRQALAGQQQHGLDCSEQVYLLATTLQRRGEVDAAKRLAQDYLKAPDQDAKPKAVAALQKIAGG